MLRKGLGLICLAVCLPVTASAAPAALLNKTVRVSFTTSIPGKAADGTTAVRTRNNSFTVYISSAGRIFGRRSRADGPLAQTKEAGPGDPGSNFRFDGNRLVGVQTYMSGAAQMVVTFDAVGQSCNASFISGREGGRAFRWKGLSGVAYEATGPASWSNVSCSVSSGNAFAN